MRDLDVLEERLARQMSVPGHRFEAGRLLSSLRRARREFDAGHARAAWGTRSLTRPEVVLSIRQALWRLDGLDVPMPSEGDPLGRVVTWGSKGDKQGPPVRRAGSRVILHADAWKQVHSGAIRI